MHLVLFLFIDVLDSHLLKPLSNSALAEVKYLMISTRIGQMASSNNIFQYPFLNVLFPSTILTVSLVNFMYSMV